MFTGSVVGQFCITFHMKLYEIDLAIIDRHMFLIQANTPSSLVPTLTNKCSNLQEMLTMDNIMLSCLPHVRVYAEKHSLQQYLCKTRHNRHVVGVHLWCK